MNGAFDSLWFIGVMLALALLFAAALRLPVPRIGAGRTLARIAIVVAAVGAVIAANVALYRHDVHLDLTREQAFTPSPETQAVVRGLAEDVELTYFYQKQNEGGRAAKTMVEVMGKLNPRLHVRTVDPDQNPGLANQLGVKLYNVALLSAKGQRLEVVTTDDREIALGMVRLLRQDRRSVCFATGHGEYDSDNFEFHTHFEGQHAHGHDVQGMAVVQMDQHGVGRWKRALEKLGYAVRKVSIGSGAPVPTECATLIHANPRTRHTPPEIALLEHYLNAGGSMLWLVEPDFDPDPSLQALLARAGITIGDGVIVDPLSHYFTDEQMIAVNQYAKHPATLGLALSFFPGARPLALASGASVRATALMSSSPQARVVARRSDAAGSGAPLAEGTQILALAVEGRLDPAAPKPFRLAVVGDADFASNSFFPYLANADLALGLVAWLRGEERGPAMKPPLEVLPLVVLTNSQMQGIFIVTVILIPGALALIGGLVWWRRRY